MHEAPAASTIRIDGERLRDFAQAACERTGLAPGDAALIADSLVQADLWGHQSHGVLRLDWYRQRFLAGTMRASENAVLASDAGAVAILEGHDGVGQALAKRAMEEAIARAKRHGIGMVAVRDSNHFGTAMYYTRMAAAQGCIGFLSTNASPAMAPWGGRAKAVGNNPWSIAAPAGRHAPMILDIANSAVARGKVYLARNRGEPIPPGWALDAEGRPTTDPVAALEGVILPMAGHKGYGISVMMDVLSGVLTGSGFAGEVNGPYQSEKRSRCGHLAMAISIASFQPLGDFEARMERYIAALRSVPLAPGCDEVLYPGEMEARNDARHRLEGLLLPEATLDDLRRVASAVGVPLDIAFERDDAASPAGGPGSRLPPHPDPTDPRHREWVIDEADEESFPASDPSAPAMPHRKGPARS
jgi:LDH2 family malate/lactate/ureidoglycolate dehydrogenase